MNELVEQIVREVMARLADGTAGTPFVDESSSARSSLAGTEMVAATECKTAVEAATAPTPPRAHGSQQQAGGNRASAALPTPPGSAEMKRPSDQLHVSGKVVTLADLADHLDRVRCVSVVSGAVVTPALRDELQRRHIALRYVSKNRSDAAACASAASELRIHVIVHQGCIDDRILQTLRLDRASIAVASSDCVIEACDAAARAVVGSHMLAVLMTRYVAAAICLANRIPQVRAVSARDPVELKAAMAMVGANVVVLDPDVVGPFGVRRLLREVAIAGLQKCPRAFGSRLN